MIVREQKHLQNRINRRFLTNRKGHRRLLSIGVSALLSISTFLTVIPQTEINAYAADSKAIVLVDNGAASNISGAQANSVYFGNYQQSSNGSGGYTVEPIKWRVLQNNTTAKTLFLLSDQNLDAKEFDTSSPLTKVWKDCTLRKWLNGSGLVTPYFINTAFDSREIGAIASTAIVSATDTDKIFLLSVEEAEKTDYGFTGAGSRVAVNTAYAGQRAYGGAGNAGIWWLRSPGTYDDYAAYVSDYGAVSTSGSNVDYASVAVRPAFNLNLSSIILTSAAEGGKSSGTTGAGALTAPTSYDGSQGWKLTVNDTSRSAFAVTRLGSGKIAAGGNMRFNYSGAKKADNEYVSAILLDASGSLLAYGRIVNTSSSTSGTSHITLPSSLVTDGNTYTLQFISEQYHTDKSTDYSSLPSSNSITFTTGKGTPTAVDFNVELPTDTTYDGSQKSATVTAETGVSGMGNITVKYKDADNNVSTSAPTDLGTYQILLDVAAGTYYDAADNITDDDWTFTISTAGTVATPTFTPAAGTYTEAQSVTISCSTTGTTIHYTTDGTTPTTSSQTYSSAINVDGNMTIKAIAVKDGMTDSAVASATYTISDTPIAVTGVSVAPTEVTLKPDNSKKLTATVEPDDATNKEVKWSSDNEGIAKVDSDGKVTAISEGEATITVTTVDGGKTAKCKVTVSKDAPVTEECTITFKANGGKGEMDPQTGNKGETIKLKANDFIRRGYVFKNWNTKADGSGDKYDNKESIKLEKDLTLYAQWKEKHEDDDDDDDYEEEPAPKNDERYPDGFDELRGLLNNAASAAKTTGLVQTVTWNKSTSLPADVMKILHDNPNVTLVFSYTYLGAPITLTIPGSAVVLNPAVEWYGPAYLYGLYGKGKTAALTTNTTVSARTYTVKSGDTLSGIAKRLKTTVKHLQEANNIKDADKIKPGMVLKY